MHCGNFNSEIDERSLGQKLLAPKSELLPVWQHVTRESFKLQKQHFVREELKQNTKLVQASKKEKNKCNNILIYLLRKIMF